MILIILDMNLNAKQSLPSISQFLHCLTWMFPSFLIVNIYSSMVLAQLLATNVRHIDSLNDLANEKNVMITLLGNTTYEIYLRVKCY